MKLNMSQVFFHFLQWIKHPSQADNKPATWCSYIHITCIISIMKWKYRFRNKTVKAFQNILNISLKSSNFPLHEALAVQRKLWHHISFVLHFMNQCFELEYCNLSRMQCNTESFPYFLIFYDKSLMLWFSDAQGGLVKWGLSNDNLNTQTTCFIQTFSISTRSVFM